jgi:plastocyanin
MLGLSGVTTVALGAFLVVAPSAGADSGSGGDTQRIRMYDDCEPTSFNQAGIPCEGDGDTTLDELVEQLVRNGFRPNDEAADDWEFKPGDVHIDHGDRLKAVNRGGEFHSFTEVPEFGPGCVPELNAVLFGDPDAAPVVSCAALGTTGVDPGEALTVRRLSVGKHRFECLIHPWMQTTVIVRADDHDDDDHDDDDHSGPG